MNLLLKTKNVAGIGAFGELSIDGELFLCTVEREWKNNEKNVSCVPEGVYELIPHKSHRFGDCYALENKNLGVTVYGPSQRSHCLFHVANFPKELQGCIAPGLRFHPSYWGVSESKKAFNKLMETLGGKRAKLTIERAL